MATAFVYDGTWTGDYGVKVMKHPEQEMADPRESDVEKGGGHGQTEGNVVFIPRHWLWVCELHAPTPALFRSHMNDLKALLNPENGEKLMYGDHWTGLGERLDYCIYAKTNGPVNVSSLGACGRKFNLNWKATYPFYLTVDEQGQTDTAVSGSPDTIYEPSDTNDTVKGNRIARPVITFKNTDSVTLTTLTIANSTRSESCTITGTLAQNHYWRIDAARKHVEKSTDGSTWVTARGGVASDQDLIYLTPAVNNTLTVTGAVTGELTITYRGEFL